jgi:hypothetical protein
MRLSHSISTTLFAALLTAISGCSSEEPGDGGGTSGTGGSAGAGMSGSGGTAGVGMSGSGGTAGAGVSGSGGTAGGGVVDHPTDSSQAAIEAYLASEVYKTTGMGWRPESMPGVDTSVPHLATNRYFNETIIASKAAGNRPPVMAQHTAGSMSIKEILEGTTVVGKAAMLRTESNTWVYYCTATTGTRCGPGVTDNTPYYSTAAGPCSCHGSGSNLSHDAIPAP